MTIQDMHRRMEQELFHVDGLFSQRIDDILNAQIEAFVRSKLPAKRNAFQEGIDDSVIAAKDLDTLKVVFHPLAFTEENLHPFRLSATLPTNCLYPLSFDALVYFSITKNQASNSHPERLSSGRIVDFIEIGEIIDNQILKSDFQSPAGVLTNSRLVIVKDKSFILKELYLTYLRKPAAVNLSLNSHCDLPDSVHNLIVDRAVAYVLENSESERVQTKSAFNQKNE